MQLKSFAATLALGVTLMSGAQAQVLGAITASPQPAKTGEPVTITANIDVLNANYCGFVVSFGDGSADVDGVSDTQKSGPFTFQHTYAKSGGYTITLGGRNVQNHPNCGGGEKAFLLKVEGAAKATAMAKPAAATVCPDKWKLVPKSFNAKTGAFSCSAKPGSALPDAKPACAGDLTYFENGKKGQLGCRP
jgi:hypothetical protein